MRLAGRVRVGITRSRPQVPRAGTCTWCATDGVEPVAAGPDVEVVARVVPDLGAAGRRRPWRRRAAGRCGRSRRSARAAGSAGAWRACPGGGRRARGRRRRRSRCARSARRSRGRTRSGRAGSARPSSPGRATTGIITGSPRRTRLRTPAAVERSIAEGVWCFSASRPAAIPSTSGVSATTAATSSRPRRGGEHVAAGQRDAPEHEPAAGRRRAAGRPRPSRRGSPRPGRPC